MEEPINTEHYVWGCIITVQDVLQQNAIRFSEPFTFILQDEGHELQ